MFAYMRRAARLGVVALGVAVMPFVGEASAQGYPNQTIKIVFGLLGYAMSKLGFEPAPLALGMVLGSRMEEALRQSMIISDGSFLIFVTRPISAALLLGATILVVAVLVPQIRKRREVVFAEEED
jgi:putative tricarboxylic transport membrane protein